MRQPDIFADTDQGRAADTVALDKAAAAATHARRYALFDACKTLLVADGLFGYPNLIRNPAGPWATWRGAGGSPREHNLCWPGYFRTEHVSGDVKTITLLVRPGQKRNPAILRAIKVLGTLGTIAVETSEGKTGLQYY